MTLLRVARLAIPALADWCIVDFLEDGETELVRRMDGSIWLEPRVGDGSRFTFELPSAEQPGATARSGLAGRSGSPERSS